MTMPPQRLRLASYPTGPRSDPDGSLLSPFGITQQRSDFAVEPNPAFGYDDLDRVTCASLPQFGGGSESFVYDPLGNRLLGDNEFTYGYDANGNLTSKTEILTLDVTTYSYDGESRLVRNWVSAKSYGNAPRHYPRTT